MAFTSITVTGSYETSGGSPAAGSVQFLLDAPMYQPGGNTVAAIPRSGTLSAGNLSITLEANDDAATLGGVSYQVTELLVGAPVNTYSIIVPSAAPGGTIPITSCEQV